MSAKIPLAIVGCGGMGHRHMYGLAELHASGYPRLNWSAHATPISTTPTRWPTKRSSASARAPKPLPA